MLFFQKPTPPLTKIPAPTAAEVASKYKPQPGAEKILQPNQTPTEYVQALEKNKQPVEAVNFMANGMPERESVHWACESSQKVAGKLNTADKSALGAAQNWVRNPTPDNQAAAAAAAAKTDYKGPGGWAAQAAAWSKTPGAAAAPAAAAPAPVAAAPAVAAPNLAAAAVAGSVMLAAGLMNRPAMPEAQKPALPLPAAPPAPTLTPPSMPSMPPPPAAPALAAPEIPPPDNDKLSKMLQPFLDVGKDVGSGKNTWV